MLLFLLLTPKAEGPVAGPDLVVVVVVALETTTNYIMKDVNRQLASV